jgi:glycosyltransferase involved in cell wall biosynthesis
LLFFYSEAGILESLRVFIIPSWYPSRYSPVAGIFIKDQVLDIGELRPKWKLAISLWGQGEFNLPLRDPRRLFQILVDYAWSEARTKRILRENVVEYKKPVLHTSERVLGGNRVGILRANRVNLENSIRDLGDIDLIHAHVSYPGGWIAMLLSEETGIPYIITEHMSPFPFSRFLDADGSLQNMIRGPLEKANAVVAVSPSQAEEIVRFGIKKPTIVPNMVNEQVFRPPSKDIKNERFVFFTLAGMVPQKGIPDLLYAISLFVKTLAVGDQDKVIFYIGGTGFEQQMYKALAKKLDLDSWVTWLGYLTQEQVVERFQNCDCFVLPSRHESFGIVCVQAIACGKPIIATRCGGPEYIVSPENGLLVEVANPEEMAEALYQMFKCKNVYDAKVIREQFMARFSRTVVLNSLESVYKNVST